MILKSRKLLGMGHLRPPVLRYTVASTTLSEADKPALLQSAVVLHVLAHKGHQLVMVRMEGGKVDKDMELVSERSRDRWKIRALGFSRPEAWEAGLRNLELAPIGHNHELHPGEHLLPA